MKIDGLNSTEKLIKLIGKNLGTEVIAAEDIAAGKSDSQSVDKLSAQAKSKGISPHYIFNPNGPNLLQRAQKRKQIQAARKQQNIEKIFSLALDFAPNKQAENNIDSDWFNRFIELAEDISSPLMQELWSKILIGELSSPGTFSYKSLLMLQQMTHKEAQSFQAVCRLCCRSKLDKGGKIVVGYYRKPSLLNFLSKNQRGTLNLSQFGLPYTDLLTLAEVGLIYQSEIESGEIPVNEPYQLLFSSEELLLKPKANGLTLTYYKLTQTGYELSNLIRPSSNTHYLETLKETLETAFHLSE